MTLDKEEIDQMIHDLKHRTIWGVFIDHSYLVREKKDAQALIEEIDEALGKLQEFVETHVPDPSDTPLKTEKET